MSPRTDQSTRPDLPSGTVTFVFTDVEGSTRLLQALGPAAYAAALAQHRRVLRQAFGRKAGVEVDIQGDALFYVFPSADDACRAAAHGQAALGAGPIRVRIGIHTGVPHITDEGYVGSDVHKAARIAAAGHGGQVLVSRETRDATDLADLDLIDLGEHRLKDFDEPVWVYQLGTDSFPPLKTISNTNLPRPASSFVGRDGEVADVVARLRDGTRLLTLTGPGGTGKTRLGIEAGTALVDAFPNGVFWVGLAPIRDPSLVGETIAQTLGATQGLARHIGEREMLLVLDNFEHVVPAAAELTELLQACPNLRMLVTSREVLRVTGEVEYRVPPLAEREAAELFCARSGLEPDPAITELCRRLDQLPLAVELAAARTSVLSPGQILDRIATRLDLLKGGRDADPRQATLRATIQWSYELLGSAEQDLFASLAVFLGGSTLDSSERVAGADIDTLGSLVDKSLLRRREERFLMLETIREFAAERLDDSAEADDLRRRHAEYFLAMAEEAQPNLRGSPGPWLDRLDREHDNLRAALDEFEAEGATQNALRLTAALWRFWAMRGYLAEGSRRLERALAQDPEPTRARVESLNGAAALASNAADPDAASRWAADALELSRSMGDVWSAANATFLLGGAAIEGGQFERAKMLLDESHGMFVGLGDEHYSLLSARNLAWACYESGERDRARSLHEDVVRRARTVGNERMEATSLGALGEYALREGRVDKAIEPLMAALAINHRLGERLEIAVSLSRLAYARALEGHAWTATALVERAERIHGDVGARVAAWVAELHEQARVLAWAALDDVELARAVEHGRAMTLDEAVELAQRSSRLPPNYAGLDAR